MENTLLDSHNTSQMLPGNKATSGPEHFPALPGVLQDQQPRWSPERPCKLPGRRQSLLCPTCPRHDPEAEACLHRGLLLL